MKLEFIACQFEIEKVAHLESRDLILHFIVSRPNFFDFVANIRVAKLKNAQICRSIKVLDLDLCSNALKLIKLSLDFKFFSIIFNSIFFFRRRSIDLWLNYSF